MGPRQTSRLRLISLLVFGITLLLVGKLYFLQIVSGKDFRARAERQYLRPSESIFSRGNIFFQNKDGSTVGSATLKVGYTLGINPKALKDPEAAFEKINAIVPIDRKNFLARAAQKDSLYVALTKKIEEPPAKKISGLKIVGVLIYKDQYRFYPLRTLAANVLGLVGYKGDTLAGRYGLESYYEDTLSRNSSTLYSNFFTEIFSGIKKSIDSKSKFEGDIVTSIEPTVEDFLEKELRSVQEKWNSRATGGIIMDPASGEIYALGNYPTFDPNALQNEKNPAIFANPIVEDVYEMGSILKPLTMAAGIDSGTVTAETTYEDKGFLVLNNSKISNFDGKGRGVVNMQTVLNESLNTGAAYVANKMGKDLFADYFRRFGFGEETGIDLPNETPGLIDNLKSPRDIEHATAAYGQGIAMSPINTLRALSILANGGYLVTPHLVKKIEYKIGVSKNVAYEKGAQVLKPETSGEISRMLVNVVDKALLGGTVKIKDYSVAAKTGTAQIAKSGGGGYYSDKYLHSFFGYFPAYSPKFIVFLYTIEPKGVGGDFASHTLTAPFINITKFLINYYKIPPDR
ncbi:MAG: Peptidoglycan glycosyltransferase [Candidatus Magasanikbacteria bacterium GW2011_GWA2_46_17]|uniref:Peptidoglycan glycosyltransferase n=1 Tax=Candidatus Magasanikbacteria bacterium GW2011_GWA2_46_17 TaxID=1619042 RepID=A0A0G1R839_9BACT|nr:MAG: Peptidoglycan glycosyltransferase [Candidatus Magasanikbacteria bacterium GW2011_GWA2_46_17]